MNMTDEEAQALQDNLQAEQDRQLNEVRQMNQQIVDKMNAKLAAQISAYGDDLPNVIRNLNDSLALQGRREYVEMSATALFNFLKATVPDVTLDVPDPGPPFVYDPTKIIDTKPTKNYATESLSAVQKMEMKVRAERFGPNITDADRRRIQFEVQNPNREYVDENTRQNEIDNAQRLCISINAWRRLEDRRKEQEQKEVDAIVAQRMGISVEDLIRIRTVKTAPDQDIRNNKPDEPRSYTDDEIEHMVRGMISRSHPEMDPNRGVAERDTVRTITDFQRLQDRAVTRQRMSMLPFMQSLVTVGPAVKIHPFDSGEREEAAHENPKLTKIPALD
jgi:hypothetical protein